MSSFIFFAQWFERARSTIICCDSGLTLSQENRSTVCITNEGEVVLFGTCTHRGQKKNYVFPSKISSLQDIKEIDCGEHHTMCLDYSGNLYGFGCNEYGQLGVYNDTISKITYYHIPQLIELPPCKQVSCGGDFTVCLSEVGELFSFGNNRHGELGIGNTYREE